MKRTVLAVLIGLACVAFVFGGGQSQQQTQGAAQPVMDNGRELIGNTYTTGLPIIKNQEPFKIAVQRHTSDLSKSFMEKEAFKKAERETGMKFEFIEVALEVQAERVPVMLASDPPDAFNNLLNETLLAQNAGSFVNLAENDRELLKKYAPHVYADIGTISDGWEMITFPNGAIYSLPTQFQVNHDNDAQGIQVIRTDWLEKVGHKLPTTLEEYVSALKAFRDGDPNGNGIQDEIPLGFLETNWASHFIAFGNPWGIGPNRSVKPYFWFLINNKKVEPVLSSQRFRDFLTFHNMLIKEKLLDPEGFTQANSQFTSKRDGNMYGSLNAWDISAYVGQEWAVLPPFDAPGYKFRATGILDSYQGNNSGFAIMKASKNPTAILRWWDYLSSSTEMKYLVRYGPEGGLWERDAAGKVVAMFPPETDPAFNREMKKYTWGFFNGSPLILKDEFERYDGQKYPLSVSRENMVAYYLDYFGKEWVPHRFVSLEASRRRIFIETELTAYITSFMSRAVLTGEGLDDAGWNNHLRQLETLQHGEWIQWYQDLVDGNLK